MSTFKVKVDLRRVPRKVQKICHDPRVLYELGKTWNEKFKEFMPHRSGALQESAEVTNDGYIVYNSPYAHYFWKGEEYVYDMYPGEETGEIHKEYFAPAGEKKFPSGDSLLDEKGISPNYRPFWNIVAYDVYKNEVAHHMTDFIKEL